MGRGLPPPLSVFFASLAFWFCGGGLPPAGARTGTGFQRNPAYARLLEVQFHTKLLALYFRRMFFFAPCGAGFFFFALPCEGFFFLRGKPSAWVLGERTLLYCRKAEPCLRLFVCSQCSHFCRFAAKTTKIRAFLFPSRPPTFPQHRSGLHPETPAFGSSLCSLPHYRVLCFAKTRAFFGSRNHRAGH